MKFLKTAALSLVFGLCLISAQAAYAADYGLSIRSWFPSLDGKSQKETALDFKNDLGIENKNLMSFGLIFGEDGKLQFDYDDFSFEGAKNPTAGYTFNGVSYNPADHVKATTEFTYIAAKWLPTYNAKSKRNFSWLFGVSNSKIKTKMEAPGKNTEKTFEFLAPIVGARYEIGATTPTSYYGEIAVAVTSGNKYSYAAEVGVKRNISKKAGLVAGYRCLAAQSGSNDEYMKISLSGPFLQLNYRF